MLGCNAGRFDGIHILCLGGVSDGEIGPIAVESLEGEATTVTVHPPLVPPGEIRPSG